MEIINRIKFGLIILTFLFGTTHSESESEEPFIKNYTVTVYSSWFINYGLGVNAVSKYNFEGEIIFKKYEELMWDKRPLLDFKSIGFLIGYKIPSDTYKFSISTGVGYINGILRGKYIRTDKGTSWFSDEETGNVTKYYDKLNLSQSYFPLKMSIGVIFKYVSISLNPEIGFLGDTNYFIIFLGLEFGKFK